MTNTRYFTKHQRNTLAMLLCALSCWFPVIPAGASALSTTYTPDIESSLETVFAAIRDQRLTDADVAATRLAAQHPDFLLGQLLHAELQSMRSGRVTLLDSARPYSSRLLDLLLEAQVRVRESHLSVNDSQVPDNLLQLGRDIKHVVAVDLEQSRLYLIDNQADGPRVINQHYAGSGRGGYGKRVEGDLRTPTGIYRITRLRSGKSLPPLYGSGALTLDYPNPLDRLHRRTGSGIWLHGVPPDNLSRAPRSSEGCVVMPNDMLSLLQQAVEPDHTLVMLSGSLSWTDAGYRPSAAEPFLALFQQYQQAWRELDTATLSELHASALHNSGGIPDYGLQHALPQALAQLSPADITVLRYPHFPDREEQERVMMRFRVTASNQQQLLTLYWEQDQEAQWRVVQVGAESRPV